MLSKPKYLIFPTKAFKKKIFALKSKPCIITFHTFADLDAIASALALKEFLGKKCLIALQDTISKHAKKIIKKYNLNKNFLKFKEAKKIYPKAKIILLDCNEKNLLIEKLEYVDYLIDHHAFNENSILAKNYWVDPQASSTAQLVSKLLENQVLSSLMAKLLLFAIITDSANFSYANNETFRQIYKLLEKYKIDFEDLIQELDEFNKDINDPKIFYYISSAQYFISQNYVCTIAQAENQPSDVAEKLIKIGADIAFVYSIKNDNLIISARLNKKNRYKVDLIEIVQKIGKIINGSGGGHPLAAAACGKNVQKLNEALEMAKFLFFSQIKGIA
jgi:nanoRNase/pAp phosphatase (c-di-AMP/oligoRNAs hydrolase)